MATLTARKLTTGALLTLVSMLAGAQSNLSSDEDPWLWLEDVTAERSLDWARARNAESQDVLESDARFAA